ncbi:MAG: ATP-dependent DNA helicase RecQ [Bacteroidota bacterium]
MGATTLQLASILEKYWSYKTFRPLQKEIIKTFLREQDTLVFMPTGGGKSLCYQLPALIKKGVCLVVSPLIALMMDQVQQLKKKGIKAAALYTGMSNQEIDITLDNCIYGNITFLYVSPERLNTDFFRSRMTQMKITSLVIDEAHCISEWGYDFRPAYSSIIKIRNILPKRTPVMALTATATPTVVKHIQDKLGMKKVAIFKQSFVRPNLAYIVREVITKEATLINILKKVAGSTIIYTSSKIACENIASFLQKRGFRADFYHGMLASKKRHEKQQAWLLGGLRIMVATSAFGMGIDKANVRIVIHMDMPTTLEAYYQETGRAGRDGKKAYAVLLKKHPDTLSSLEKRAQENSLTANKLREVYQFLSNYYQVAVGSYSKGSYPLDLEDFTSLYRISMPMAQTALNQLQIAGLITYDKGFFTPSKIHITSSPTDFYHFKGKYPEYKVILEVLILLYQGLIFKQFTPISLKRLGRKLSITVKEVEKQLLALIKLKVLSYIPANNLPRISFLTPRYPIKELPIPVSSLRGRQHALEEKLKSVQAYLHNQNQCRAVLLASYFGEAMPINCKICDKCLEKKQKRDILPTPDRKKLVLDLLDQKALTLQDINRKIGNSMSFAVNKIVEELLKDNSIYYDENGWIRKKNQKN